MFQRLSLKLISTFARKVKPHTFALTPPQQS